MAQSGYLTNELNPFIIPLRNKKFLLINNCDCVKICGYFAVCAIGFYDFTPSVFWNSYLTPFAYIHEFNPSGDLLSNGNFAVTYSQNPSLDIFLQIYSDGILSLKGPILVNRFLTSEQNFPKLITLANDKFLITWQSYLQDGSLWGIYAKIYYNDLTILKEEFLVNTYTNDSQYNPFACQLGNENIVIAWNSFAQDGFNNNSIYMQIFDENGEKIGNEIPVTKDSSIYDEYLTSLVCLKNQNILLVWNSQGRDGSGNGVYAATFNEAGIQNGNHFLVNTSTIYDQMNGTATALRDGRFLIVWQSWGPFQGIVYDSYEYGIYLQIYDENSVRVGENILVNTFNTVNSQTKPSVKALLNGIYIITWQSIYSYYNNYNNSYQLYQKSMLRYYDFDRLASNGFYYGRYNPHIAALENGNFVIVWWANIPYHECFFTIIDKNRRTLVSDKKVNNSIELVYKDKKNPKVVSFTNFFIIFIMNITNCSQIYATKFDLNGNSLSNDVMLTECSNYNNNYGIILDMKIEKFLDDKFILIWGQYNSLRDFNNDIYFQIYNQDFTIYKIQTKISLYYNLNEMYPSGAVIINVNTNQFRFVFCWQSYYYNGSWDIFARIFNSDFTIFKEEFMVNSYSNYEQKGAIVVYLKNTDGKFAIFYTSDGINNSSYDIVGQVFDFNGNKIGVEIVINNYRYNSQFLDSVYSTDKYIWLSWYGNTVDNSNYGIGATKVDFNLNFIKEIYPNSFQYGLQNLSALTISSIGQLVITWNSEIGGLNYIIAYDFFEVCQDFYFADPNDNLICKPCAYACQECSNTFNNCTSCKIGALKKVDVANNCYFKAPLGYYLDSSDYTIWSKCDSSCLRCVNSKNFCLLCQIKFYPLVDNPNACYLSTSLIDGYFYSILDLKHMKCAVQCAKCVNSSENCTQCSTNYYFLINSTQCLNSAPVGYYLNSVTSKFEKCSITCSTCLNTDTTCLQCAVNYFPLEDAVNTCNNSQPPNYYFNTLINKWSRCDISCNTCDTSPKSCTQCAINYFPLESNLKDCRNSLNKPISTFLDITLNKYRVCDITCYSCIDSASKCTVCSQNYYSLEDKPNTCIISNINRNYSDPITKQGYYLDNPATKYFLCDISCIDCVDSKKYCLNCNTNNKYYPKIDNKNSCINSALIGYFFNKNTNLFEKCDISCYTCENSSQNCIQCNNQDNYYKLENNQKTCKNFALDGYYFEVTLQSYNLCDKSCFTCIDKANKCTKCSSDYYFLEDAPNTCMNYSLPNYYLDKSKEPFYHRRCSKSCELCIDKDNYCTKCNSNDGYFPLVTNISSCWKECPNYYWKNFLKKECSQCDKTCKKCSDDSPNCQVCAENYFPRSDIISSCWDKTPDITYTFDKFNLSWYLCPKPAYICNEDKSIRVCLDGYFLLNNNCIKTCPNGYWGNLEIKECVKCLSPCANCKNQNICLSCVKDFYLHNLLAEKNCISGCPINFYADKTSGICKACNPACISCNSDKICNSCNKGFFFYKENSECVTKCPDGFFIPENSGICTKCLEICKTCAIQSDLCLSCKQNLFYDENLKTCLNNCKDGFYGEISNNICKPCDPTCLTCKGKMDSDCLSCNSQKKLKLLNGFCSDATKCPGKMMKKKNSDDCIDITSCFDLLLFDIPKIFSIQLINYKVSFVYKLKQNCNEYANDISVKWSNTPEKSIISDDNLSLEIANDKLKEGKIELKVDILYNYMLIKSITGNTLIITYKLIPIIKNEGNLIFIYGFDIRIDGSLSYDEGSLQNSDKNQEKLSYSWICPVEFNNLCQKSNNGILNLTASDYSSLISNQLDNKNYEITFNIKKDKRNALKIFIITIKKPLPKVSSGETTPDLSDLIIINPLSRGGSPELLLEISYLDKNLNILDYKYYWTISHFLNDSQYLNSRKEPQLKISNDDLLTGYNEVKIEVTDKTGKTYFKIYNYEKNRAPYGGNCAVSPMTGVSMKTDFKFIISGWISKSLPLVYKIKYSNKNKNYVDISNGGFAEEYWISNLIPVANDFILEISDSSGLFTEFTCAINVKVNKALESLDFYLGKELDPKIKLLILEVYGSNKDALSNDSYTENAELNNKALDMMDSYLNIPPEKIKQDLENIISKILDISNKPFDLDKLLIVNKSIKVIVDNIEPLLQYIDKMQIVYRVLDNIFKKASSIEELIKNKDLLEYLQNNLNIINSKLFGNIIKGQGLLIENENYNTKMNKVSPLNVPTLEIIYDSGRKKVGRFKKTRIRILQNTNSENDCSQSYSAICIPPGNITNIMNNKGSNGVGFQGQLNHKDNLPIEQKQFSNSLDFALAAEDKNGKLRKLEDENLYFEIRLKMPFVTDKSVVQEATCVQYTDKNPDTSCESWFDLEVNEVVCYCNKQGLTVNVMDKSLTSISKIAQFPNIASGFLNPYSIGIITTFIIILFVIFFIGYYRDKIDNKSLIYMNYPNYDFVQHYLIKFRKEKFENEIQFWGLFKYLLKNSHPILSIFNIYDPIYNRKLRIMDFFFNLYLTFFFTLLPFYATDNTELDAMKANRSIQNRNKSINDLQASLKQILQSVIYSVLASVLTIIITTLISLFLYEDITLKDSVNKKKLMQSRIMKLDSSLKPSYFLILKKLYFKIRTLIIFMSSYSKSHKNYKISNNPCKIELEQDVNYDSKNISYSNNRINHQINQEEENQQQSKQEIIFFKQNQMTTLNIDHEKIINDFHNKSDTIQCLFSHSKNLFTNLNKHTSDEKEDPYQIQYTKKDNINKIEIINNNKYIKEELNNNSKIEFTNINQFNPEKLEPDNFILYSNRYTNNCISTVNKITYKNEDSIIRHHKFENKEGIKNLATKHFSYKTKKRLFIRDLDRNIKNTKKLIKLPDNEKKINISKECLDNSEIGFFDSSRNLKPKIIGIRTNKFQTEYRNEKLSPNDLKLNTNTQVQKSLTISSEVDIFIQGKKEIIESPKKFIAKYYSRSFIFPTKYSSIFSCNSISFIEPSNFDDIKSIIKGNIKIIIILIIYLILWIYIAVFVQVIYVKYGKNIIEICVMPLVSMLFTKLVIVVNIMILIATAILYFKGKEFINSTKHNMFMRIIFTTLVPPIALNHFSAILTYQSFAKLKKRINLK